MYYNENLISKNKKFARRIRGKELPKNSFSLPMNYIHFLFAIIKM